MEDKVEEYLKIIYSENELNEEKEKFNIDRDRKFISENIEEINKKFEENEKVETDKEVNDIENKSTDEESLNNNSNDDNKEAQKENSLEENNDDVDIKDNKVNETSVDSKDSEVIENNIEVQKELSKELLKNIMNEIKINQYFALLHPEYNNLDEDEQYYVLDDKTLIRDNLDAIDAYYQDCKTVGSGAQEMEWTDQMIVEMALELFNKQEKIFTPNDIEQFSNKVKYEEFKKAISTMKEIANDEVDENN